MRRPTVRILLVTIALVAAVAGTAATPALATGFRTNLPSAARTASHATGPVAVVAQRCGDKYGQFLFGREGILVVELHQVPCPEVRKLVRAVAHRGKQTFRLDRYTCREDKQIKAGGGATRCASGRRSVVFGFE